MDTPGTGTVPIVSAHFRSLLYRTLDLQWRSDGTPGRTVTRWKINTPRRC